MILELHECNPRDARDDLGDLGRIWNLAQGGQVHKEEAHNNIYIYIKQAHTYIHTYIHTYVRLNESPDGALPRRGK